MAPKYPAARWVRINGHWRLSVTIPDGQHITVTRQTGWYLLIVLRDAMRRRPGGTADNGSGGDYGTDSD